MAATSLSLVEEEGAVEIVLTVARKAIRKPIAQTQRWHVRSPARVESVRSRATRPLSVRLSPQPSAVIVVRRDIQQKTALATVFSICPALRMRSLMSLGRNC